MPLARFGLRAIVAAVATCLSVSPSRADTSPIELGMIASLSGPIGDQGGEHANGARLAAGTI